MLTFRGKVTSRNVGDFVHQPLDLTEDTIRVLKISPAENKKDTKSCTLRHARRTSIEYVCLSYRWGKDISGGSILINGKTLRVRPQLANFLIDARRFGIKDWLWIDAICIDQKNVNERNHQVQQMTDIYKDAKHVLLYPGRVPLTPMSLSISSSTEIKDQWSTISDRARARALARISASPYWNRAWVAQEILLAKSRFVVTAWGLLPWDTFSVSLLSLSEASRRLNLAKSFRVRDFCDKVKETVPGDKAPYSKSWWNPEDFFIHLQAYGGSECSDVRDRIYGLLGLLKDTDFTADYDKSPGTLLLDTLHYFAEKRSESFRLDYYINMLSKSLDVCVATYCADCAIDFLDGAIPIHRAKTSGSILLVVEDVGGHRRQKVARDRFFDPHCRRCGRFLAMEYAEDHHDLASRILWTRVTASKLYCQPCDGTFTNRNGLRCVASSRTS